MSVEKYAIENRALHPAVIDFLEPYFPAFDLQRVRVKVYTPSRGFLFLSRLVGVYPAIYVRRRTITVEKGRLNASRESSIRAVDLSTSSGMGLLAHETKHVQQWLSGRLKLSWQFISGVFKSLLFSRMFYDHRRITYEIEAIEFEKKIRPGIQRRAVERRVFEGLR